MSDLGDKGSHPPNHHTASVATDGAKEPLDQEGAIEEIRTQNVISLHRFSLNGVHL